MTTMNVRIEHLDSGDREVVEAQMDAADYPPSLLPCPDGAIGVKVVLKT